MKDELGRAKERIDFVSRFPGCRLDLAGGSSPNKEKRKEKYATMCAIYNEVAVMADKKGVPVDVHPHSHHGSIIETAEEYETIRGTSCAVGSTRIKNVHLKDADRKGKGKALGKGMGNIQAVLKLLEEIKYTGWIIAEEDSDEAFKGQAAAIGMNRSYLRSLGYRE